MSCLSKRKKNLIKFKYHCIAHGEQSIVQDYWSTNGLSGSVFFWHEQEPNSIWILVLINETKIWFVRAKPLYISIAIPNASYRNTYRCCLVFIRVSKFLVASQSDMLYDRSHFFLKGNRMKLSGPVTYVFKHVLI